jgi:hypothetical protein
MTFANFVDQLWSKSIATFVVHFDDCLDVDIVDSTHAIWTLIFQHFNPCYQREFY